MSGNETEGPKGLDITESQRNAVINFYAGIDDQETKQRVMSILRKIYKHFLTPLPTEPGNIDENENVAIREFHLTVRECFNPNVGVTDLNRFKNVLISIPTVGADEVKYLEKRNYLKNLLISLYHCFSDGVMEVMGPYFAPGRDQKNW